MAGHTCRIQPRMQGVREELDHGGYHPIYIIVDDPHCIQYTLIDETVALGLEFLRSRASAGPLVQNVPVLQAPSDTAYIG